MGEPSTSQAPPPGPAGATFKGAAGRTRRETFTVTGASGDTFQAAVFTQINATESPELRALVMEGRPAEVTDPTSGARYPLALPLVYHDEALRLFALVLPDSMRHLEFAKRAELLARLADEGTVPRYVREFHTVFGAAELAALEQARGGSAPDILQQQRQVENQARDLARERQGLQAMRLNLEGLKNKLQEQEAMLRTKGTAPPAPLRKADNEPTTVVPREVFYGQASALDESKEVEALPWGAGTEQGWELDEDAIVLPPPTPELALSRGGAARSRTSSNELPVTDDAPRTFNRLKAGSRAYYHAQGDRSLLLSYRLPEERMQRFSRHEPHLFLQFHDLEEFPLITILLAALDEEGNLQDDLYWPLDIRKDADKDVLGALSQGFELRAALYGEDLKLRQVLEFKEPLELNAQHLLSLCGERLTSNQGLSYDDALRRIEAPDYERLGSMRHNFHRDSFTELDSPSKVKLAAGIVGYWSGSETFRYLIENRSFSLAWFADIQERVVRGATRFGIALTAELRTMATEELSLSPNEQQLLKSLTATWAEVELGVRHKNDLDPLETWENWQELIDALETCGESLDDELAELARASLRRAQEFAEDNDLLSAFPDADIEDADPPTIDRSALLHDPLAEQAPGVEPTSPSNLSLSGIDDEELKAMLVDEDSRLSAALQLLKHGEPDAVMDVLIAADRMNDDELEMLSEQLAACAPRLEDALIDCLGLDNPTIAYLCSFALASIPSAKALPALFEAIQDDARTPDPILFSETLTPYGESLLDALIPALAEAEGLTEAHPLVVLTKEYGRSAGKEAIARIKEEVPEVGKFL